MTYSLTLKARLGRIVALEARDAARQPDRPRPVAAPTAEDAPAPGASDVIRVLRYRTKLSTALPFRRD